MTQVQRDSGGSKTGPGPDKAAMDQGMRALSYLISGVLLYGALGWVGDHFLHTNFLLPIGIVVGAALGIYVVIRRLFVELGTGSGDEPHSRTTKTKARLITTKTAMMPRRETRRRTTMEQSRWTGRMGVMIATTTTTTMMMMILTMRRSRKTSSTFR